MRYIISSILASAALASAARAEIPVVVTDIPPVHSIVAAVMEGVGEPVLLLPKGASEHSYQLKPSQAAAIEDAGLVVWVGPELTPWLDAALTNRDGAAATLGLLAADGTARQTYGSTGGHDHGKGQGHDDHGHDDHGHDDHGHGDHGHGEEAHAEEGHADHGHEEAGHGDEGHDHDHSGLDPHAWLDPANGKVWAGLVAAELSRIDPENAATYAANAETVIAAIDAADAEAAARLAPVRDKPFVAFHDAYGYFTGHYGLTVAGTVALGDASAPGAQRLAGLREMVETGGAVCLFPEVNHDPALVAQLAEGTGVRVGAPLDPVGTSLEPGPGAYASLISGMAGTLADCLAD